MGETTVLSGISVLCFAASYSLALLLELSRFFWSARFRDAAMIGCAAAGFLAHTIFLGYQVQSHLQAELSPASWFLVCLFLSWVLVAIYLISVLTHRQSTAGLFLLPASLALITSANLFPKTNRAVQVWSQVHGFSLAIGTGLVVVGFVAAILYLLQSYRLKHKLLVSGLGWLPSLERLQKVNERSLYASVACLGLGLITGILLNLISVGQGGVIPWSDPVVLASLVWLVWLIAVVVFGSVYRPARTGRKVAYMTISSFLFLSVVLGIISLIPSDHVSTLSAQVGHHADRYLAWSPLERLMLATRSLRR